MTNRSSHPGRATTTFTDAIVVVVFIVDVVVGPHEIPSLRSADDGGWRERVRCQRPDQCCCSRCCCCCCCGGGGGGGGGGGAESAGERRSLMLRSPRRVKRAAIAAAALGPACHTPAAVDHPSRSRVDPHPISPKVRGGSSRCARQLGPCRCGTRRGNGGGNARRLLMSSARTRISPSHASSTSAARAPPPTTGSR